MRALTFEELNAECLRRYKGTFKLKSFDKVYDAKGRNPKVWVTCTSHGDFLTPLTRVTAWTGCPRCGSTQRSLDGRDTLEEYIVKARGIHGNKFEYLALEEKNIIYFCATHGKITQSKYTHLTTKGCAICGRAEAMDGIRDTVESFANKASKVHGSKYTYNAVNSDSVTYTCETHGEVVQSRRNHLSGTGCPKCGHDLRGLNLRDSFAKFIEKARAVHGDVYTYLELTDTNVKYICPIHNEISQVKGEHLGEYGCPSCGEDSKLKGMLVDLAEFAAIAATKHNSKYTYLTLDKLFVTYSCEEHGELKQSKAEHLKGYGCPKCFPDTLTFAPRSAFEEAEFISRRVHKNKYFYKELNQGYLHYVCPTHGDVIQLKTDHISGHGCAKCGKESAALTRTTDLETFKQQVSERENLKGKNLEYVAVEGSYVFFNCHTHGLQTQVKDNHLKFSGCPECAKGSKVSKFSAEVENWLKTVNIGYSMESNVPYAGTRMLADFVVGKVVIELNGNYWHTEDKVGTSKHLEKLQLADSNGYELMMFSDAEWSNKQEIIKQSILRRLGLSEQQSVGARKLAVKKVEYKDAKALLDKYHMQGATVAGVWFGLYLGDELLSVAGFSMKTTGRGQKRSDTVCELVRFCSTKPVVGAASKLINHAHKTLKFTALNTFSDNRFFCGKVYKACGFVESRKIAPSYSYIKAGKPTNKASLQKSAFADNPKLLYDPTLTERELAELNGFKRIYDAGKTLWVKTYK